MWTSSVGYHTLTIAGLSLTISYSSAENGYFVEAHHGELGLDGVNLGESLEEAKHTVQSAVLTYLNQEIERLER